MKGRKIVIFLKYLGKGIFEDDGMVSSDKCHEIYMQINQLIEKEFSCKANKALKERGNCTVGAIAADFVW